MKKIDFLCSFLEFPYYVELFPPSPPEYAPVNVVYQPVEDRLGEDLAGLGVDLEEVLALVPYRVRDVVVHLEIRNFLATESFKIGL